MASTVEAGRADLFAASPGRSGFVLLGTRCTCGHTAFPRQRYGCERCGRMDAQEDVELDAIGTVAATATAHVQLSSSPKVPFTVGAVRLDAGPVIRAFLDPALAPGDRAIARMASGVEMDNFDLVFAPTTDAGKDANND